MFETNKTDEWATSLELLQLVGPLAASETARARVEENLGTARENAKGGDSWCAPGYHDLPPELFRQLEEARRRGEAREWDAVIAILEPLAYREQTPFHGSYRRFACKCLAYSYHRRAIASVNAALDKVNEPPAIIQKVIEHSKRYGSNLYGLSCMACGRTIYGEYIVLTFKDVPLNICLSCSAEHRKEKAHKDKLLKEAIDAVYPDLMEAAVLDPGNHDIEETERHFVKLGSSSGFLPASASSRTNKLWPVNVGSLNSGSEDGACWFCNGRSPADPGSSLQVPMQGNIQIKPQGMKKVAREEVGVVTVPRCRDCSKAHKSAKELEKTRAKEQAQKGGNVLRGIAAIVLIVLALAGCYLLSFQLRGVLSIDQSLVCATGAWVVLVLSILAFIVPGWRKARFTRVLLPPTAGALLGAGACAAVVVRTGDATHGLALALGAGLLMAAFLHGLLRGLAWLSERARRKRADLEAWAGRVGVSVKPYATYLRHPEVLRRLKLGWR